MTDWLNISKRTKIDHHLIIFYLTELKNELLLIRKSICIDEFSHFRVSCSSNSHYYLLHSLPPTIHVTYYYYHYYYSRCLLLILFSLNLPFTNLLASSSYSRYFIFQSLLSTTTTTLVASSCYYTRFSSNSCFYSCYLLFLLTNLLSNLYHLTPPSFSFVPPTFCTWLNTSFIDWDTEL